MSISKTLGIVCVVIAAAVMSMAMTNGQAEAQAAAETAIAAPAPDPAALPIPRQPQLLFRIPGSDGMLPPGGEFPTFAEIPLPPTPAGVDWEWTYHKSRWKDGCVEDQVSYGGAVYWLTACCCGYTMSRECPEEYCD